MYDRVGLYRGKKSICRVNNSKKHLTKRFMSRITVRRYVSHMVETHELESSIDYRTGGRPSIQYQFVGR